MTLDSVAGKFGRVAEFVRIQFGGASKPEFSRIQLRNPPRRHQARGLGPEDLVRHYPYLTLAEIHSAMAYYHDHQDEIDAEIQEELDQLEANGDANSRSPLWPKLKAKGAI